MHGSHEARWTAVWMAVLLALVMTAAAQSAGTSSDSSKASSGTLSPEEKARLKKLDDGPKKIDVSGYPAEQQAAYKVFAAKCSHCHSLGRAINTTFVLPSEWERYVKRMTYKPNSHISEAQGKQIYHFLVYDSSVRKAAGLKQHLGAASAEERAEEVKKIQAVNPAYKE